MAKCWKRDISMMSDEADLFKLRHGPARLRNNRFSEANEASSVACPPG